MSVDTPPDQAAYTSVESALRESEARLQQILANTTAAVFAKDREGRYLYVNREFERLVERPARDVVGRTDYELFSAELAARFRHNDLRVLLERRAIEFEETADFAGACRTFLSAKFPLLDAEQAACGIGGIATDITERKRIEAALSSAALAVSTAEGDMLFTELARYLVTILDVDASLIAALTGDAEPSLRMLAFHVEGETRDLYDYPLAGTPCETVFGRSFRIYSSSVAERFPMASDFRALGLDSYAGYPINDSNGRPLGVISVMSRGPLEQTGLIESVLKIFAVRVAAELERMRSETALRASEASYRGIFEASEDAIFIHDWDTGAILDVNPKACAAYGYTRDEFLKCTVDDLSSGQPPYTGAEAAEFMLRARQYGSARCEWHRRNKDGTLRWDEVSLKSATIGGSPRILAFTRDITERKASEEGLRRSEDRLRLTLQTALDCIVVMNEQGRIIEFNPAAEQTFGIAEERAVGQPLADLLIPIRHREAHARGLEQYLRGGPGPLLGNRVELTALRADTEEFPVELSISVAEGASGRIFIGYLRDITERKLAEERREKLEAQLRQAQKMEAIGQLTGGIAHDFNNLLTSIMGYIVLALERQAGLQDARLASYLDKAHASCETARDLIEQMLMFSRGQRGAPRPLTLAPLIDKSLSLLKSAIPETVQLTLALDAEAPEVLLDPVQLEQVLLNLCINARDALHGAGTISVAVGVLQASGEICASCRQSVAGHFVELRVSDDGPGIPPAVLDRMFEPFFSTKEVGKGSGMGLATLHGIVHEHAGHVLVETHAGRGTQFRVLFPPLIHDVPAATPAAPAPAAGIQTHIAPTLRGHILVVDDEETVGGFMRELLDTWGLDAAYVRSPDEALALVAQAPARFDLVITDHAMPRMTGLELARALRAIRADLPVVLYTGFGEKLVNWEIEAAGIRTVLTKPLDPRKLEAALARHLNASG